MALLSLIGRLGLDTSNFEGGLKKAESASSGFAANLTAKVGGALAAAFSVAAIKSVIEKTKEAALEVKDLAEQYSLTTDEVQLLSKAAKRIGLEFESIAGPLGRIAKARAMLFAGGEDGEKVARLFKSLGVNATAAGDPMVSTVGIMKMIADEASKATRSSSFNKDLFELLGKNAVQVKNVMVELRDLGPVKLIRREDIEMIDEADKKLRSLKGSVGKESAPIIGRFSNAISRAIDEYRSGKHLGGGEQTWDALGAFVHGLIGELPTAAPDSTIVQRLAEKKLAGKSKSLSESERLLLRASNPQAGGMGNVANLGPGNLGNIGGYFFGGNVNNAIANNTLKAAGLLTDIKKDTAAFRNLLGNEGGAQ